MSRILTQARRAALEWKMALLWFILFSVNSLGTCILSASAGSVWSNLGTQEKVTVVIAVFTNWAGSIMAFFSKSAKKVQSELESDDDEPAGIKTVTIESK